MMLFVKKDKSLAMSEKLEIELRKKLFSRKGIFFKNFDFKTGVQLKLRNNSEKYSVVSALQFLKNRLHHLWSSQRPPASVGVNFI